MTYCISICICVCVCVQTGFSSPSMTDPLKGSLKGQTAVIHLNNLAWNVTKSQIKEFCGEAGKKYISQNKHLDKSKEKMKKEKKNEGKKKKKSVSNPYYSTDTEAGKYCTIPIEVFIKYRNGYSTGRAVECFLFLYFFVEIAFCFCCYCIECDICNQSRGKHCG